MYNTFIYYIMKLSLNINLSLYCYQIIAVLFIEVIIFFNIIQKQLT
uniref:Uncharacterized protein n=1 Tax=Kuetzingia canaliculata TaxID=228262 RepID=A0A1Z1MP24_KUECA|nr:hypothetical protein [Kuetzingia canaliculata]ARW67843.1 hypothetical protein [Kuetzingia canaliculata]